MPPELHRDKQDLQTAFVAPHRRIRNVVKKHDRIELKNNDRDVGEDDPALSAKCASAVRGDFSDSEFPERGQDSNHEAIGKGSLSSNPE